MGGAARGSFRFTKKERIAHPQDFRRVKKSGRRLPSRNFILFIQKSQNTFHRLGIVVKKEIGPATFRNRMKRYIREFFRLHKHQINGSYNILWALLPFHSFLFLLCFAIDSTFRNRGGGLAHIQATDQVPSFSSWRIRPRSRNDQKILGRRFRAKRYGKKSYLCDIIDIYCNFTLDCHSIKVLSPYAN